MISRYFAVLASGCLLLASVARAQASTPGKGDSPAPATPGQPTESPGEAKVISTQERILPGSDPHSPGTWGHAFTDPRNFRRTPGALGGLGVMRVGSANLGKPGLLRLSAYGDYFLASNFPVPDATNVHSSMTFSFSCVPSDFLEVYLAYSDTANTNSFTSPELTETLGDLTLGLKVSHEWAPSFHTALEARLLSFAGVGSQDVRGYGFGFAPSLLITYDFRALTSSVPLLAHLNLGYVFDGSKDLMRERTLTASEEFALRISRYDRFTVGAGWEVPLPVVTPFVEYTLAVPLFVPHATLVAPDGTAVPITEAMPQRVGLGLRLTAIRDITITAGGEIGLTPRVGLGLAATPPYNLFLAASFTVDPLARPPEKVVEIVRERTVETVRERTVETVREVPPPPPKTARVEGVVIDAATGKPMPGAIVTMVGAGLPPVATEPGTGRFITHELPFGPVRLSASKDGYQEASRELSLELGKSETVELALNPLPKKARFLVSVSQGEKKIAATVSLSGAQDQQVQVPEGAQEPIPMEVAPGRYHVQVTSPDHLAQEREVQISENAELPLQFDLKPRELVEVLRDTIQIRQQVRFAFGEADILADSGPLLAQVVDAIRSHGLKKVRIEGHTDNKGNAAVNLKLSQDRASSVADWLVKAGIDRSSLETAGYGDTRPIEPNTTAQGRELNRRVEFVVVEH